MEHMRHFFHKYHSDFLLGSIKHSKRLPAVTASCSVKFKKRQTNKQTNRTFYHFTKRENNTVMAHIKQHKPSVLMAWKTE